MAQETPETPLPAGVPEGGRKEKRTTYLWSRSTNGPVGENAPGSETSAVPGSTEPPAKKLDPKEFHENFPAGGKQPEQQQHGGIPSISEAVKTIKTEDFLTVSQTPCARDGFLAGIASGAGLGALKYVFRARNLDYSHEIGTPLKAANWAVGGFLMGSIASFEYCQYQRRQERVRMKRTVEVYQETMAEKRAREAEALEKRRLEEEAVKASQRAWYKFW
ncbi:mitochondrial cytochrome c oxidase protein 20-like protein [Colletotrichum plurivorum]|uniref:Cytochrome c oxidase assembly protein COX20, mitochondrial n=1 Tax=Colletotrichum plurivorum TaxID=2175906 RepID=A0A8H6KBW4_9PEZI|nr:mitochondrial cytochrome c oxidase protein 20-like protein [Colletotrichum plurivorum]